MAAAYIGLGSNLEEPRQQLRRALEELQALDGTQLLKASGLYSSPPMGPADQPDYLNAVAAIETMLKPLQLLDALQGVERAHHRIRGRRWGARTLDLDLLLYDDLVMQSPRLQLPHPGITQRAFVLLPLLEIAPEIVIPERGRAQDYLPRIASHAIAGVGDLAPGESE